MRIVVVYSFNEMAEEVTSTATKISLFSALIPHPGINIVKTWQGIVEIVLRGVVAVSCVKRKTSCRIFSHFPAARIPLSKSVEGISI